MCFSKCRKQTAKIAATISPSSTGFFKAAFEPWLFVSLRDARTPQSRQDVIDSFSEKLRIALAQDPEKNSCHWRSQLMLISKSESKSRVA
jgi:hypothetical protein